jgi:hypothetical protein
MVFVIVCVRYYGSLRISTVIDYGTDVSYLLYKKFVEVVNSQIKFNEPGNINAFPIVGYHKVTKDAENATSPELFYLEMQYLFDNGFKVITIDDLGYDKYQERVYIKNVDTFRI